MTTRWEATDRADLLAALRLRLPGGLKARAELCTDAELRALLASMDEQSAAFAAMGFVDANAPGH